MMLLVLVNLGLLSVRRMNWCIRLVGLQGAFLGLAILVLAPGPEPELHVLLLAGAVFAIKALAFPVLLRRTMRTLHLRAWVEPYIGYGLSLLAGLGALLFSLWLGSRLAIPGLSLPPMLFPAAFTAFFGGLLMLVSRKKALTQVVGFLAMENGIFLFGAPTLAWGSTWMELAVLLDVFVAVFVMGLVVHRIDRTFDSIDVGLFCSLRD
jgi:hydrogenase-4 component E